MQIQSYMLNVHIFLHFTIVLDVDTCFLAWPIDSVVCWAVGREDTISLTIAQFSPALLPLA